MSRCGWSVLVFLIGWLASPAVLAADFDRYLWEAPRVRQVDTSTADPLIQELELQVQAILAAGLLAPLRLSYGDTPEEAHWLYYERGRIITTLAWALPYLSPETQSRVCEYVRKTLSDSKHSPFEPGILGPTDGATRALHGRLITQGRYVTDYGRSPTLHVLYGLWLYGDRSGDWNSLKKDWPRIKARYLQGLQEEPILYGQMGAHIAVARLAHRFRDEEILKAAQGALQADLDEGRDIHRIVQRLEKTRFARFLQLRNRGYFPGECWIFLDACPEILRFLADTQREEVLGRVNLLRNRYPLWWLMQAPYFTRWTGDESVGVTPEIIGIIAPAERWIAQADAETLSRYVRSAPVGIGDCYWIEALVFAIEAHGKLVWQDIR